MELNEISTSARNMLKARTDSLQNDVKRCCFAECKDTQFAPFPALLYCFSTIDLLGSLYGGDAQSSRGISDRSKMYMAEIMRYPEGKAELLQKVSRHKIVHLAQPNPEIRHTDRLYIWCLKHNNQGIALKRNAY